MIAESLPLATGTGGPQFPASLRPRSRASRLRKSHVLGIARRPRHANVSRWIGRQKTLERFVDWQINEGSHGLVPVGTTGESPTLSHAEHRRVVEMTIAVSGGRVPVIAGAGSNSTAEAIDLARHAKAAGADAVLVVTPYYNKPTQEGLYLHFEAIADQADIPVIIYNIPGRSVVDMSVATMARLALHPTSSA